MSRLTRVRDIFGGKGAADPAGSCSVHSSFVTRWCAWDTLTCKGEAPSVRSGHAAALDETGTFMYVLGGYHNRKCHSDLFRLHLGTYTWSQVHTIGDSPAETASHSMVIMNHRLIVFGGSGVPFGRNNSDRVHILDLATRVWEVIDLQPRRSTSDKPTARYGQTLVAGPDNALYLFGGTSGHVFSSELFRLDIDTGVSERLYPVNNGPPPCYKHESVVHDGKMYVIGGGAPNPEANEPITVYAYSFARNRWDSYTAPAGSVVNADVPTCRRSHSCAVHNGIIYMCGGTDGQQMFDCLWAFDTNAHRWSRLPKQGFVHKYFHTAVMTPAGRMFVYGGCINCDGTQRTSEVATVWLGPFPTLAQLCIDSIVHYQVSIGAMRAHGVPESLVDEIMAHDQIEELQRQRRRSASIGSFVNGLFGIQ